MTQSSCTIYLQNEYASQFFEQAMCPDIEELRQRDDFLESVERELHVRRDGADLIADIPDIRIGELEIWEGVGK